MNRLKPAPDAAGLEKVIFTLEAELKELDRIGAHIAAAHLDAAIQQIRRHQTAAGS